MKETFLKVLANIAVLLLVIKILYNTYFNQSVWEREPELSFLTNETYPQGMSHSIKSILGLNEKLVGNLDELRRTLFFKILKVNFDGECTFFTQNMICNFPSCGVCQCEDSEIPLPWKQESKEKEELETQIEDKFYKWVDKYNNTSSHWILNSEVDSKNGIYVNLLNNPEAYTGYQGPHIWNAIFRENCFSDKLDQICREEKVFYRLFSGLLANINIQISSNYYDTVRNHSYVNLTMFKERVADHKDRIDNLFFLYSVLLKAFDKAEYILRNFDIYTGNQTEDNFTRQLIDQIYNSNELRELDSYAKDFDEDLNKFINFNRMDQLIMRFRNISSIIDCVSCQKCKLHGKLQIYGIATMMKILFDKNYENKSNKNINLEVSRNELIAFVNLFAKVARSVNYIRRINDNLKYTKFVHNFKYVFIISCYFCVAIYINFFLFKKKKGKDELELDKIMAKKNTKICKDKNHSHQD